MSEYTVQSDGTIEGTRVINNDSGKAIDGVLSIEYTTSVVEGGSLRFTVESLDFDIEVTSA